MNTDYDKDHKQLIGNLRNGKEAAFNALYQIYGKPLYLRLVYLVKDVDVADELLQDLFMKVWLNREALDPEKSFKAYLYTIAQNLVYNYFRKVASDQSLLRTLILKYPHHTIDAGQLLEHKQTAKLIQQAIDQLTTQRKQVFVLCKIEGRSYEEAAQMLGISTATVNSHMTKAIQSVKEYLLKHPDIILLMIGYCLIAYPDNC